MHWSSYLTLTCGHSVRGGHLARWTLVSYWGLRVTHACDRWPVGTTGHTPLVSTEKPTVNNLSSRSQPPCNGGKKLSLAPVSDHDHKIYSPSSWFQCWPKRLLYILCIVWLILSIFWESWYFLSPLYPWYSVLYLESKMYFSGCYLNYTSRYYRPNRLRVVPFSSEMVKKLPGTQTFTWGILKVSELHSAW